MIYDVIKKLSKKKGISINGLEQILGFSKGSLCRIDVNKPSADKLQKIANYFGVTTTYLLTGRNEPDEKIFSKRDEKDIEKRLQDTLNDLASNDSLMFNGEAIDERTKELLEISLRNTIESAKIAAKKFTPNKYKK